MKTKLNILMVLALAAALVGGNTGVAQAAIPQYAAQGSVSVPAQLTAVDPLAYFEGTDVIPARPFLYSVDQNGLTITRFNDNAVVGTWPWPDELWITLPDGGQMAIDKPADGWEPVAMTVSFPTALEFGNRAKEIPDLTPPWTFVYVVMAHSGYQWVSAPDPVLLETSNVRDHLVPSGSGTDSSVLVQFNVNDPSFSASRDPAAPTEPHIAGAILGRGAGQPVYDPKTGNVYVGNMPASSLPDGLTSFVSVVSRIPDTVAAEEREIPGIGQPVIRCGPQHPETGIPVGMPQAYACYDPGAMHIINDNEHVGGFDMLEDRDADGTLDQQYVWEFRNLPDWLMAHQNPITGELDGILYGTPPATGEWWGEARVHNLDDEYGIFSDWHPIRLLVTPTAEYLPVKAQFAVGTPVSYPLHGAGSCALEGAPAWVESVAVPNGCVVMGRAPISGEHYNFSMPGFRETAYPNIPIVFSGDVVGGYGFVPMPEEGVGLSGLAWHQVSKVADPSTETAVLSGEFIGVEPSSGQLYQVLQAPGQPQAPNERPAETQITVDVVSAEGEALDGSGFGQVAVEADRDIFVAVDGGVIKVSGGAASTIPLGFQPSSLSLDSDLRPAILGVEPGQVDHGALWAAGAGKAAVIDTVDASVQSFDVTGASSVSVDFGPRWAYVSAGSNGVAIFGPEGSARPPMEPRIWSSEELNFNRGYPGAFQIMATGDPLPTIDLFDDPDLPAGLTYTDIGDGFPEISGTPADTEGGDGYAYNLTATNEVGSYAQAFGITVYGPSEFTTGDTATFTAGSASSFTVSATSVTAPILYTWDEEPVMAPGIKLVDHEDGTAGLQGIATTPGTYNITIGANTGFLTDAEDTTQAFTLEILPEGKPLAPSINSLNTAIFEAIGAPYSPDQVTVTSIGSPTPTLSIVTKEGQTGLPEGVNFIDNGDSTGALGAACQVAWPGMAPECLGLLPYEAEGTWTFTITATNEQGTAEQEFTLYVEIATSIMTPGPDAPANLSFAYTPGGPVPEPQIFSVGTLGDTLPYAAVTTTRWLGATPVSGTVPSGLSVSVDPTGLVPGTYTGTVLVTSAGTEGPFATALVTLTVVDPLPAGTLGTYPSALSFSYNVNDGILPPAQSILVMSGGVPLDYTVSTGEARWLSASASGTSPSFLSVSVDPKVGVGMHIANLTIASGEQTQVIPVTLLKTAGDSDLIQVMFDVGSGPEGIAANLTTHNLFITSSNAAAEAAEAGEPIVPAVEQPGPPDPPLVFHINPLDKTLLAQIVVHGEAEYIGANSTTGLAYQASQATGEIAVIDGSTNSVLTYIDLTLDGYPQSPYQVAIDEAQNFIYVGAKSPEPEPYALTPDADGKYGCKAIQELPSDEGGEPELDCWHPGPVIVIDGFTNQVVSYFMAGDDPEGVVFAAATGKVYASNEDDGNITVAQGAVRNSDGSITPPVVLGTIIKGELDTEWQLECNEDTNYCGERDVVKMWLWPQESACHGTDDEAEEADKMTVDPAGNVYIIDDRYRLAKIDGATDEVVEVIEIPGYDCEETVPDDSPVVFRNTANNIAYMPLGQGKLYVTSEQNTLTLIQWKKQGKKAGTTLTTLTLPEAAELDAITTDPALNQVYITDENLASLWILKGACANGVGVHCTP